MRLSIAIFLSIIISMQSIAAEISPFEINRAIDEFQYELTVNWDQRDESFLIAARKKYLKIFEDFRIQGLTAERLVTSLEPRLNPDQNMVINNTLRQYHLGLISDEQLTEDIFNAVNKTRPQGTSWNGETVLYAGLGFLVAGFLAYAIGSVVVNLSRCGISPRYCCKYYGWIDTNGDGFCNSNEEVQKWK